MYMYMYIDVDVYACLYVYACLCMCIFIYTRSCRVKHVSFGAVCMVTASKNRGHGYCQTNSWSWEHCGCHFYFSGCLADAPGSLPGPPKYPTSGLHFWGTPKEVVLVNSHQLGTSGVQLQICGILRVTTDTSRS